MTPQVFQGALNNTATKIYSTFIIIFHSGVSWPIEQHRLQQPAVGLSQQPTVWLYQQPAVGLFQQPTVWLFQQPAFWLFLSDMDPLALSSLTYVGSSSE